MFLTFILILVVDQFLIRAERVGADILVAAGQQALAPVVVINRYASLASRTY